MGLVHFGGWVHPLCPSQAQQTLLQSEGTERTDANLFLSKMKALSTTEEFSRECLPSVIGIYILKQVADDDYESVTQLNPFKLSLDDVCKALGMVSLERSVFVEWDQDQ